MKKRHSSLGMNEQPNETDEFRGLSVDAVRSRDDTRLDAAARIQSDFAKNADANRICVSCIDMFVRHVAAPYYLSVSVRYQSPHQPAIYIEVLYQDM